MNPMLLAVGTAFVGLGVALAAFAGRESIGAGLQFVEDDLRDKLRRLRVNTRNRKLKARRPRPVSNPPNPKPGQYP